MRKEYRPAIIRDKLANARARIINLFVMAACVPLLLVQGLRVPEDARTSCSQLGASIAPTGCGTGLRLA
jgi:hypothetical protein